MFVLNGSKLSLLPNIYDVDAVGIGATNKEFLAPNSITSFLRDDQSYLSVQGFSFQRSN
jgi:hypothetical protein